MHRLWTVTDVAAFLGVKIVTVLRAIRSGALLVADIGGARAYRVLPEDLFELVGTTKPLLTAAEVGELLQLHPETIRRMTRAGKIKTVDFGSWRLVRYRVEDIEALARGVKA